MSGVLISEWKLGYVALLIGIPRGMSAKRSVEKKSGNNVRLKK